MQDNPETSIYRIRNVAYDTSGDWAVFGFAHRLTQSCSNVDQSVEFQDLLVVIEAA